MATITDVHESARGCGFRKPGGFYLRTDGVKAFECGKLSIELCTCKFCGSGIKFSRGYRWIKGAVIEDAPCDSPSRCEECPFGNIVHPDEDMLLIWIGKQFYPTPKGFLEEAGLMGISRRLTAMPRGFKIGETKVALAHQNAIPIKTEEGKTDYLPGIFYIFTPDRMEYTVKPEDNQKKLDRLEEQGVKLVRVHKKTVNQELI
jgi:hypothetical protein